MPVVSQSIIRPIVPVGASTVAWELRTPDSLAQLAGVVPRLLRGAEQLRGDELLVDVGHLLRGACRSTRSMCSSLST